MHSRPAPVLFLGKEAPRPGFEVGSIRFSYYLRVVSLTESRMSLTDGAFISSMVRSVRETRDQVAADRPDSVVATARIRLLSGVDCQDAAKASQGPVGDGYRSGQVSPSSRGWNPRGGSLAAAWHSGLQPELFFSPVCLGMAKDDALPRVLSAAQGSDLGEAAFGARQIFG